MTMIDQLKLPRHASYWELVRSEALKLGSDGCTDVPDWHVDACYEHDIHYRTGTTLTHTKLYRWQADQILRERIQEDSPFGAWSPMSWWRWAGVRLLAGRAWKGWLP